VTGEAPDASVLLLTGCIELGAHGLAPNVEIVALPALRKLGNGRYGARRLPVSGVELRILRAGLIRAAVESFRPDVLLVDKHPMGVRGELRPAVEALSECGGHAVLGLRDILDDPATVREEWSHDGVIEYADDHFDRLLIYGNPEVYDFVGQYGLPASLARRARYCGYVLHPDATQSVASLDALPAFATGSPSRPTVLATAGGGEDGQRLLEAFVRAAQATSWDAAVVAGPQSTPANQLALRRMAEEAGVEFHASVADLPAWLPHVDALVSMGGYNTLSEALSRGTPTLCVPRADPRTEQLMRARAFAGLGLLRLVEPGRLSPDLLRAEVEALLGSGRREIAARAHAALGFGGARLAARELLQLASVQTASANPAALQAL
jgi:predicted glycosyltransferase